MAVEAKHPVRSSGWHSARVVHLVGDLLVPVLFCAFLVAAKAIQLAQLVSQGALDHARGVQEVIHLALTITFFGIAGFLFLTRKKVVGRSASWTGRLIALAGGVLFPVLLGAGAPTEPSSGMLLMSIAALIVGNMLSVWAITSLGRCFGVFPVARGLVMHGPYRFVRHPLYFAEAIAIFGFLLTRLSPATVAIFVGGLALQAWRAVHEERALAQVFPEYAGYQQRTGRFFPRLR